MSKKSEAWDGMLVGGRGSNVDVLRRSGVLRFVGWVRSVGRRLVFYPVIYGVLGVGLYLGQSKLLFPAPKTFEKLTPANCYLEYEDLRIRVNATDWIHAWWIPGMKESAKTILVFHGNGYVLEEMLEEAVELNKIGANLLLVDYRGYGSSSSLRPDEASVDQDAEAALQWLFGQRPAEREDVFVLGRSIGSGPATYLAVKNPGLGGLILETPFTSVDDAARESWLGRIFPVHLMLRTHFDNLSRIGLVKTPVLIIAGAADTLTPAWMAAKLYANAKEPKQLYVVAGAGHNDLTDVGGAALREVLRKFVR